jgi:hypothetical protein
MKLIFFGARLVVASEPPEERRVGDWLEALRVEMKAIFHGFGVSRLARQFVLTGDESLSR